MCVSVASKANSFVLYGSSLEAHGLAGIWGVVARHLSKSDILAPLPVKFGVVSCILCMRVTEEAVEGADPNVK